MSDPTPSRSVTDGLTATGTQTSWCRYVPQAALRDAETGQPVAFFERELLRPDRQRRFVEADLFEMILRAVFWLTVRVLPPAGWPRIAGATSRIRRFRHNRRKRPGVVRGAVAAGLVADDAEGAQLFDAHRRRLHERRVMFARDAARPDPVTFEIEGLEALEAMQAAGRGAILWTSPFAFQTLVGKRGLHEAGQRPVQISATRHGFSDSAFGIRVLNAPLVAAENRYLSDRLVLERDTASSVLRRAVRALKSGTPVYFTNNVFAGRSFLQVPFGPGAWFLMPQTPLFLARRHGFALFAVETIETRPFAAYRMRLTECPVPQDKALSDHAAVARAALAVRDVILDGARAAPDQFLGLGSIHDRPVIALSDDPCGEASGSD